MSADYLSHSFSYATLSRGSYRVKLLVTIHFIHIRTAKYSFYPQYHIKIHTLFTLSTLLQQFPAFDFYEYLCYNSHNYRGNGVRF